MMSYTFGAKRDHYDSRDWNYQTMSHVIKDYKDLPKKYHVPNLLPVKNQGSLGTCVAFSLSACKEYQEGIDNPLIKHEEFSPMSLYMRRKPKGDSGMYPRNALKLLQEHGMCLEAKFQTSRNTIPNDFPQGAEKEALNYRIKGYARVKTINEAKRALVEQGPLLISFPVYSDASFPHFWKTSIKNSRPSFGHAVAVVGYDEKGFILRNSWGASWNGNGHVCYPFEEWGVHWDLWSLVDEEHDYIPDYVKTPQHKVLKIIQAITPCIKST